MNKHLETTLHKSAYDPKLLRWILDFLGEEKRHAVQAKDTSGNTVLHRAWCNLESFQITLDCYPEQQKHLAIEAKDHSGETVLHGSAHSPKLLQLILETYPKEERLKLVQTPKKNGDTVVRYAVRHAESLQIIFDALFENDRLATAITENKWGDTPFEYANLPSLRVIFASIPLNDLLKVVRAKNKKGRTLLHGLLNSQSNEVLKDVALFLQILPREIRLTALQESFKYGTTFLEKIVAKHSLGTILEILKLLPPEDRFAAVLGENCLLTIALGNEFFLTELLSSYFERDTPTVIEVKNRQGKILLSIAGEVFGWHLKLKLLAEEPKSATNHATIAITIDDTDLLGAIFELFPVSERLEAVTAQDSDGKNALQKATPKEIKSLVATLPTESIPTLMHIKDERGKGIISKAMKAQDVPWQCHIF